MSNDFCGVYCIENKVNGKKYVGQSITILKRWKKHVYGLNSGKHVNSHLQSAWAKYGKSNFMFYILELCARAELNHKETLWIAKLGTFSANGYNLNSGGDAKELSDEAKRSISMKLSGEKAPQNKYSQEQAETAMALICARVPRGYIADYIGTPISFVDNILKGASWKNIVTSPWGIHKAKKEYVSLYRKYKNGNISVDKDEDRIREERTRVALDLGITLV